MQWRGQGLLVVTVLVAAAGFGYQWKSMTNLVERVRFEMVGYEAYTRPVSNFVWEARRWPFVGEVSLPPPVEGGLIKKVQLLENGELYFTLTGWTITGGHVSVLLAPTLNTENLSGYPLSYECVEVKPQSLEPVVCSRKGSSTRALVAESNKDAFERWEAYTEQAQNKSRQRKASLEAAKNVSTQCDYWMARAEQTIIPCMEQKDPDTAVELKKAIQTQINGPRLSAERIVSNPDALRFYNQECDENWNRLVSLIKISRQSAAECIE